MCLADTVVASWSLTQEMAGSSTFDDKYFVSEYTEFLSVGPLTSLFDIC